jgi:RNA polymerase sigma-70 factor (ECF subfamily)
MRAAYAAIDRRRRAPSGNDEAADLHDDRPSAAEQLEVRLAAGRLYRALERIDDKHRVAFALAVIDERPLQEVAELTESSVSAVKTRVFRARKELLRRAAKDPVLATYLGQLSQEDA